MATLYAAMAIRPWSAIQATPAPGMMAVPITGMPGFGFIPVFETRAEAEEFAGGGWVAEFRSEVLPLEPDDLHRGSGAVVEETKTRRSPER